VLALRSSNVEALPATSSGGAVITSSAWAPVAENAPAASSAARIGSWRIGRLLRGRRCVACDTSPRRGALDHHPSARAPPSRGWAWHAGARVLLLVSDTGWL